MGKEQTALTEAVSYTNERIKALRADVSKAISTRSLAICIVGSYGRKEASPESDLDFFFLADKRSRDFSKEIATFRRLLSKHGIRKPSSDGAFDSYVETCEGMVANIGGFDDPTQKLTRRLLFLLEGDCLYNRALFDKCRRRLISHYVRRTITEHQLCKFLLNDLIRYYRTICVDFECKTHENGKSWGDRNIKLQFSRKLLYFSGILVVAETWQSHWQTKRILLMKYLKQTPIERMTSICGEQAKGALQMYDDFLEEMAKPAVREMLKETSDDRKRHTADFRKFKNRGHHFTLELSRLLANRYDGSHPIHVAIKF